VLILGQRGSIVLRGLAGPAGPAGGSSRPILREVVQRQTNNKGRDISVRIINLEVSPPIQPPMNAVMPSTAQGNSDAISGIIALFTVLYLIQEASESKSSFSIFFWLATFLPVFFEPIIDIGMTAFYPRGPNARHNPKA
jgi:hypothetical protein